MEYDASKKEQISLLALPVSSSLFFDQDQRHTQMKTGPVGGGSSSAEALYIL